MSVYLCAVGVVNMFCREIGFERLFWDSRFWRFVLGHLFCNAITCCCIIGFILITPVPRQGSSVAGDSVVLFGVPLEI